MTKLRFRKFGDRRCSYAFVARVALPLILLSSSFSSAPAQTPQPTLPFARGEELVYQAEFTRGLLRGIDVAEFHFRATSEHVSRGADDPIILRLTGDVVSKGLFLRIAGFKFHQHVESTAQPAPFTVLHTNKVDEQGKRSRVLEALFNHETHKATWTERHPNPSSVIIDFSEPIQDVLTVIYFLRTQKLEVGKSFDVPLSDAGRVYRFSVKAVERRQLNTVLGRVNAIRVEPALFGDAGVVRARGLLSIWVTDDERRLPVRAQLKVDIGTFDIKLKRLSYLQPN
jgi:uncharacterized protein DUF3108